MTFRPVSIVAVVVGLVSGGCSSSDAQAPAGNNADGGAVGTDAGAVTTSGDGGTVSASSDGGSDGGKVTATATVAGKVTTLADLAATPKPLAGATVALYDAPSVSTLTTANGTFSLGNVPVGEHVLSITMNDHWTEFYPVTVGAGGLNGLERTLFTNGLWADFFTSQKVTQSGTKGMVTVTFPDDGGHGATITAQSDPSSTIDSNGALVPSPVLLSGGDIDLAFTNVTVGTTKVTVTGGSGKTCTIAQPSIPSYPVAVQSLTRIVATCK